MPAASGTDREGAGQLRFGPGRERRNLIVSDMNPVDRLLQAESLRQPFKESPTIP